MRVVFRGGKLDGMIVSLAGHVSTLKKEDRIRAVARVLAADHARSAGDLRDDFDPDGLEPGDVPCIDGYMSNGDPGHFYWRQFVGVAEWCVDKLDELEELAAIGPAQKP
ncbi:MAG TPA: hypothetical protein PLU30_24565 [Verrucomicrobiae bacterium]|nr:hypothetical protein [Verrucomicrobiae bacterium]